MFSSNPIGASRGVSHRLGALEVRVALLRSRVEEVVALLRGERVAEALAAQAVVVVHQDRRDRLDAPVDLRRAQAEGAAAAHADHADALAAHERSRAQVVNSGAEVLDEDVGGRDVARRAAAVAVERRVEGECDESAQGHVLGIDPRALLLDPAIWRRR
jgi:hypothetical protein